MSWQCTDSATRWMLNSKGESPCQLVSRVLQTCQPDASIITTSNGYGCYTRPNLGPSECCCSSITYALYSACWECQWGWQLDFNKAINTTYNNFVAGCQMPYISTFPPAVDPAIRSVAQIPSWAAMPPMGNTLWDINAAKANATFGAGGTSSATVTRSSPTSPSGQNVNQGSYVAPTAGTVAGAVIGSIAGLLLIGGLVFYFIFWRRKQRQQKLAPSMIHRSLQMSSHPHSQSQLPPHHHHHHPQPAPLTTTTMLMHNEKPQQPRSGQPPAQSNSNATGDDLPSQGQIEGAQWYFKLIPWRKKKIEHAGPGAKVDLAEEPVSPVSIGGKSNTDPTPHSGGGMSGGAGGGGRPGSLGYQYAGVAPYLMGPGTGVAGGVGVGGMGGGEHGSVGHQTYSQTHGFGQVLRDPESPPPPPVVHVTPLTTPIPSRGQGYPGYGIPQVDTPQQALHPPMPPPQQPQQQQLHNRPLPLPPSSNSSPPNQNPFTDASIGQLHPIAPYPTLAQNRAAAGGASSQLPPPVSGSKRASAATSKGGKKRSRLQVVGNADSDDDSGSDGGGLPPSQQYLAEIAMSDAKRVDEKAILAQRERDEEARQAAAASELHRRRAHLAQGGGGAMAVPLSSARAGGSHDSHNSFAPPLSMPHQQLPTPSYSAYPSPPAAGPIVDASRSQPHLYPHPDASHNLLHQQYQQPPRGGGQQYVDPRFTPPRITPALLADEARREEERIQEALRMAEERRKSVKNWVEESRQSMRGNGGMSVAERLEGPNVSSTMPTLSDVGHGSTSGGGHGARIDLFGGEGGGGAGGGAGAPSSYKNRTGGGRW